MRAASSRRPPHPSSRLRISDDLVFPIDVVTQKLAFLGRTGSGKTYAATKLAELMLAAGAQIVALDPVGVWHGLRVGSHAFAIPVLGGLHGDIPLECTGGALVADLIVDHETSAVLDVSQMIPAEQTRFATDFATRFFQRKKAAPSAVHVYLEECQEVVPQNPMKGEERMLHAFQRLQKLGRNFGIGVSLISQRPQEVSKKALNQTECVFAFQMTGPQERKAMAGWVAEQGLDTDVQALLPKLAIGQAHVWSPQWMNISKTLRIAAKETADVSATPLVGAQTGKARKSRELSPIDLDVLGREMAAAIARAKDEDPKELRKRIVELEKALRVKSKATPIVTAQDIVSIGAIAESAAGIAEALTRLRARMISLAGDGDDGTPSDARSLAVMAPSRVVAAPARTAASSNGAVPDVSQYALRLLETMVQREPMRLTLSQLSTLSGRSRRSSAFGPALSEVCSAGLATKVGDCFEVTDAGRALVPMNRRAPLTPEDVVAQWRNALPPYERGFFDALVDVYPEGMTREALAERTGKSTRSSAFGPALSSLVKQGLAHWVKPDVVCARNELFQ